jgi:hypothetical protein
MKERARTEPIPQDFAVAALAAVEFVELWQGGDADAQAVAGSDALAAVDFATWGPAINRNPVGPEATVIFVDGGRRGRRAFGPHVMNVSASTRAVRVHLAHEGIWSVQSVEPGWPAGSFDTTPTLEESRP